MLSVLVICVTKSHLFTFVFRFFQVFYILQGVQKLLAQKSENGCVDQNKQKVNIICMILYCLIFCFSSCECLFLVKSEERFDVLI